MIQFKVECISENRKESQSNSRDFLPSRPDKKYSLRITIYPRYTDFKILIQETLSLNTRNLSCYNLLNLPPKYREHLGTKSMQLLSN